MEEKYCPQCGAPIEDGAVKCRFCETPIVEGEVIPPNRTYVQQENGYEQSGAYGQQSTYQQNGAYGQQSTYQHSGASGQQNGYRQNGTYHQQTSGNQSSVNNGMAGVDRILAAISYVGILVLVPILVRPNSQFIRFHVNQGLVLFLLDSLIMLAGGMFGGISLIVTILSVIKCVSYALMVFGILCAVQGREKELPLVGKIKLIR